MLMLFVYCVCLGLYVLVGNGSYHHGGGCVSNGLFVWTKLRTKTSTFTRKHKKYIINTIFSIVVVMGYMKRYVPPGTT